MIAFQATNRTNRKTQRRNNSNFYLLKGQHLKFLLSFLAAACTAIVVINDVHILTSLPWLGQDDGLSGQSKAQFLREKEVGSQMMEMEDDGMGTSSSSLVNSNSINGNDNGNRGGNGNSDVNGGNDGPVRKWAYAFLAGGCSRENGHHRGFIANIAVAAKQLQSFNSTADVVALIQMSHTSKYDTLSDDETKLLEAMPNVKIQYIPRYSSKTHEMFYNLMMEKFRVLDLTDYSRVIFMDGDVMPLGSMDYLFDLSEPEEGSNINQPQSQPQQQPPLLMENLILSWTQEPAHGGFFMLKPNHDDYLRALEIIHTTEKLGLEQPWPHFDEVLGFGQKIDPSDPWQANTGTQAIIQSTNWTWHGSFADQGFLYHWVKYEKKNVSIINGPRIDNYFTNANSVNEDGEMILQKTTRDDAPLSKYSPMYGHRYLHNHGRDAPKIDFVHFVGAQKPWHGRDRNDRARSKELNGDKGIWFSVLESVEKIANVTMEFPDSKRGRKAPVGAYPVFAQRRDSIMLKAKNNWTMYA